MKIAGRMLGLAMLLSRGLGASESPSGHCPSDDEQKHIEVTFLQSRLLVENLSSSAAGVGSVPSFALTADTPTSECSFVYPGNGLACKATLTVACCAELNKGVQNGPPCHNDNDAAAAYACFLDLGACCSAVSLTQNVALLLPSAPHPARRPALLSQSEGPAECIFVYPGNGLACKAMITVACCAELNKGVQNGPPCHNDVDAAAAYACFLDLGACCSAVSLAQNAKAPLPSLSVSDGLPALALAQSKDPTAECTFVYPGNGLACKATLTVACCAELNKGVQNGPPCHNDNDAAAAYACFLDLGACCSAVSLAQNQSATGASISVHH